MDILQNKLWQQKIKIHPNDINGGYILESHKFLDVFKVEMSQLFFNRLIRDFWSMDYFIGIIIDLFDEHTLADGNMSK